jgi:hypothetical protein
MPFSWLSRLGGQWLALHAGAVTGVFGAFALLWLLLDLVLRSGEARQRGRVACLSLAVLAVLASRAGFHHAEPVALGLLLLGHLLVAGYLVYFGWPSCSRPHNGRRTAYAAGLVLASATLLKLIHLGAWPPILTDYAARTGVAALATYERGWDATLWLGQANDFQSGGTSPLHVPVLWALYQLTGPNPYSVRLAEVIGSTLVLLFLWLWLSRALPGWWGVTALALVSFSPEHLAQSRMGTYLSVSLAVALALLWLAERVARPTPVRWYWWAGLGVAAALIGYGYTPLRILYLFVASVLVTRSVGDLRAGRQGWQPAVTLVLLGVALAVQTSGAGGAARMFQTGTGLATDTAVWNKTREDVVTRQVQPWPVIVRHLGTNAALLAERLYAEGRQQVLFAPACSFGALFAVVSILRGWGWVAPLYYLLGLLPPLLVYPVMRRGFVMQPLVLVAAALFLQGYLTDAERLSPHRWWRPFCRGVVGAGLICTVLYGLHQFAAENGPVGIAPTFGTIYRHRLTDRLIALLPRYHIYLLNVGSVRQGFDMSLYQPARQLGARQGYEFVYPAPSSDPRCYVRPDEPVCFAYLEQSSSGWIAAWLQEKLPDGRLEQPRAEGGGQIMYTLYCHDPAAPPGSCGGGAPPRQTKPCRVGERQRRND